MNYTDLISRAMSRGYTVRKFPGGERPMIHRWPADKIKGALPLSILLTQSITWGNPLFRALTRKKNA